MPRPTQGLHNIHPNLERVPGSSPDAERPMASGLHGKSGCTAIRTVNRSGMLGPVVRADPAHVDD
jgi:hypothetical protein